METSILLAKIFGLVFLVVGISLIANRDYYFKIIRNMPINLLFFFFSGIGALVIGLLLVTYHNIWVQSWVVIITIFGWLALIKGIIRILAPQVALSVVKSLFRNQNVVTVLGILMLILGVILGYFGFIVQA